MTRPRNRRSLNALIERAARKLLASVATEDSPSATDRPDEDARPASGSGASEPVAAAVPHVAPLETADAFRRELGPAHLTVERAGATRLLYDRLSDADVSATEQLLRDTPGAWQHYAAAGDDVARQHLLLALGMWLASDRVIAKTGLIRAEPPEDVHTMTRGALAAAGGLYEADMLVDALSSVDADMTSVTRGLDFGCSSGRVLRVLSAAFPNAEWHGCDPNGPAIEWASENLPDIEFFVNSDAPPLPLAEGSLDFAYAISIWSHFEPALGLRWFEEMHRLIRPGGHLVCTTHGWTSVAHYALGEMRTPEQSGEIADAMYRQGWWYAPEFGEEGDWGVVNDAWGTAFLTPEWMLTQLCPRWHVLEFAPGRNQNNQDVFVLRRV